MKCTALLALEPPKQENMYLAVRQDYLAAFAVTDLQNALTGRADRGVIRDCTVDTISYHNMILCENYHSYTCQSEHVFSYPGNER